ncbi:hypothetical protein JB92DRAFT_2826722 [Gautieria morchelliformis]|nr:hypothetical protein JB92DRAFT_2826722 [Gautieria morchelliformis]
MTCACSVEFKRPPVFDRQMAKAEDKVSLLVDKYTGTMHSQNYWRGGDGEGQNAVRSALNVLASGKRLVSEEDSEVKWRRNSQNSMSRVDGGQWNGQRSGDENQSSKLTPCENKRHTEEKRNWQ